LDKLLQITQQHLNWKYGYSQAAPRWINPTDKAMNEFQLVCLFSPLPLWVHDGQVFPIDYIVFIFIIAYFVAATMEGIRRLGVRVCIMKVDLRLFLASITSYQLYTIRPGRSPPQALLFTCFILMLVILSLNVVLLTLAPQYMTYGNQHYPVLTAPPTYVWYPHISNPTHCPGAQRYPHCCADTEPPR
jgi:LMBR1 domain-containing protein 1